MYKEFVKQDEGTMVIFGDGLMTSGKPENFRQLRDRNKTVQLVESHFFDIKTILNARGGGVE